MANELPPAQEQSVTVSTAQQQQQQQRSVQSVPGQTIERYGHLYNTWEPTYTGRSADWKDIQIPNPYYDPRALPPPTTDAEGHLLKLTQGAQPSQYASVEGPAAPWETGMYTHELRVVDNPNYQSNYFATHGPTVYAGQLWVNQERAYDIAPSTQQGTKNEHGTEVGNPFFVEAERAAINAKYTPQYDYRGVEILQTGMIPIPGRTYNTGYGTAVYGITGDIKSMVSGGNGPPATWSFTNQYDTAAKGAEAVARTGGSLDPRFAATARSEGYTGTALGGGQTVKYGTNGNPIFTDTKTGTIIYGGLPPTSESVVNNMSGNMVSPNQTPSVYAGRTPLISSTGDQSAGLISPPPESASTQTPPKAQTGFFDTIAAAPAYVAAGIGSIAKTVADEGFREQQWVAEQAKGVRGSVSGYTGRNVNIGGEDVTISQSRGSTIFANAGVAAAAAIASSPGFFMTVPNAIVEVVKSPYDAPQKAANLLGEMFKTTVETEKTNPGSLAGTIVGSLAFGKSVSLLAVKGVGYARTQGMEYVPIEQIGYEWHQGYPVKSKSPGAEFAQTASELQTSFEQGKLTPAADKMILGRAAGHGGTEEVPYVIENARLGNEPIPTPGEAKPIITYTGHSSDAVVGNAKVGEAVVISGAGTSELPGLFAAPIAEGYFASPAASATTKLFDFKVPGINTGRPTFYQTEVPALETVSKASQRVGRSELQAIEANNKVLKASGVPKEELPVPTWTTMAEEIRLRSLDKPAGQAYLPQMKGEYEAVIPQGTVLEITGRRFYTVIDNERVPIVQQKTIGFVDLSAEEASISAKGGTSSSSGSYSPIEPRAYLNPLSAVAASISDIGSSVYSVSSSSDIVSVPGYSTLRGPNTNTFTGWTPEDYSKVTTEESVAATSSMESAGTSINVGSEIAGVENSSISYSSGASSPSPIPSTSASSFPSSSVLPYSQNYPLAGPPSIGYSGNSSSSASSNIFSSYGASSYSSSFGTSSYGKSSGEYSSGASSSGGSSSGASYSGSRVGGSSSGSSFGRSFADISESSKPQFPFESKTPRKRIPTKRPKGAFLETFSFDVRSTYPGGVVGPSPIPEARARANRYQKEMGFTSKWDDLKDSLGPDMNAPRPAFGNAPFGSMPINLFEKQTQTKRKSRRKK